MTTKVTEVNTLSQAQYDAVRRQVLGKISINSNTTPLEAGFQLGVQSVLNVLREGFTRTGQTPERE